MNQVLELGLTQVFISISKQADYGGLDYPDETLFDSIYTYPPGSGNTKVSIGTYKEFQAEEKVIVLGCGCNVNNVHAAKESIRTEFIV